MNNGDGTFQPAVFVLADFGAHAGPVVQSITVDFHTNKDNLNDDTLLHVFVKNRSNDSSDSEGSSTFDANLQSYQDHDADWFGKNPYLGCAINASRGQEFGNDPRTGSTFSSARSPSPSRSCCFCGEHPYPRRR